MLKAMSLVAALTLMAGAAHAEKPREQSKSKKVMVQELTLDQFQQKVYNLSDANASSLTYLGDKPAIVDFYASWCGPCRMTAPIMKELAKEYAGKIVIYKVNVDKEKELAALFNATSIPLFVFVPMQGEPQLFRGAADKATYKKAIDEFLLKK